MHPGKSAGEAYEPESLTGNLEDCCCQEMWRQCTGSTVDALPPNLCSIPFFSWSAKSLLKSSMNIFRQYLLAVLIAASASACATAGPEQQTSARPSSTVISPDEIRASTATNAFELLESLRPNWLQARGLQSLQGEGQLAVYLNGIRIGGPEELRSMALNGLTSVRYLDARTATQRWGTGHPHGAIVFSTAPMPR